MENKLWRLDYRTIRAHIIDQKTRKHLLRLKDAIPVSIYSRKSDGEVIGWDIDLPLEKTKFLEKILGVKCDCSDC